MTSVLPLRPSMSWKRIDHEFPLAHPVCDTFRHELRVYRNQDVGRFVNTTEDLDGSPKLGCKEKSGLSKCNLSKTFGSVAAAS